MKQKANLCWSEQKHKHAPLLLENIFGRLLYLWFYVSFFCFHKSPLISKLCLATLQQQHFEYIYIYITLKFWLVRMGPLSFVILFRFSLLRFWYLLKMSSGGEPPRGVESLKRKECQSDLLGPRWIPTSTNVLVLKNTFLTTFHAIIAVEDACLCSI